ncbi:hypothetical protein KSP39_PZI003474 [Platanthera zijinensis]|uniref:ARM repeat N-terminal plant domain-containing protein n=1 Tax=Platanthera zijinensis TaxID=2320716 RepID=A0AAP0BUY1_9ASPA
MPPLFLLGGTPEGKTDVWVEQRVAVRALGHLATYASTFPAVARHDEVLELAIQLSLSSLEIVYSHFYKSADRRPRYHCDF